jgi:hypothetical protein
MLALLLDKVTVAPPEGAAAVRVTVQLEVPGAFTVAGEQLRLAGLAGATRLKVAVLVTPPALAVTVALWFALTCAALAVKLAEDNPAPTVTLAGTVRFALLLESATANPPPGAAAVSDTVHPVLAGVVRVVVVQLRALSAVGVGRVIVPLPPTAGMGVPATVEATTPLTRIPMEVVEGLAEI